MSAGAFERLHPAVQYHIVNSLGWQQLRPQQLAAIAPILAGHHCLVLAPTAGGKTEAALLPVLSRMLTQDWGGLSVLYICPLKALLNDLEHRLSRYAALVGRRVQVWHGDISHSAKTRSLREAPDILLTTPESLEGMLISLRVDRPAWFGALRVAIIDELHAFAGDDRGWHLRSLLGRLGTFAAGPIQRLGLSATIGNPRELLGWLTAGCVGAAAGVVVGEPAPAGEAEVTIDFVGNLANAATVISRLHRGAKRLVFCDSRARVEELSSALRDLGVRTFVSHASLSLTERHHAEQAFGQDSDCVIVATSTLELGIDVGDLDYVIQIDAPAAVSSFLQRMGRTGRRPGSPRNCLFLTTTDEALLIAGALVSLWQAGFVEPVEPPPEPWHLVAQQAMALVLQGAGRLAAAACREQLAALFPELAPAGIEAVTEFMLASDILAEQDGLLGFGRRGERLYGRRHFLDLLSSFATPTQVAVRHGTVALGSVDPLSLQSGSGAPCILLLGGRSWRVAGVDWPQRVVWVEPSGEQGKARWMASSRALGFALCQGVQRILCAGGAGLPLSRRAQARFQDLLADLPQLNPERTSIQHLGDGVWRWWTFAGGRANATLAALLGPGFSSLRSNDFYLEGRGAFDGSQVRGLMCEADAMHLTRQMARTAPLAVKFVDALPPFAMLAMTAARVLDMSTARAVVEQGGDPTPGL
ncbi:DEAD/DEAH box helicase [Candidatus Thiodictyon syntrophicum]|uniref:ATP-dependent helicase n=1 Tax=Candidatus Thiodictyon syntrophicum TaxID=1166950 RepID=A0A2K8UI30_9GAMM|nr:DEAD/DEAH box helicase [Candidatus Thiodictyon syntrophicum]AUB85246.1 ATP-dependent helicase [Candidatus Thiodictyon syntrophicum]